ncbi:MAG TPA: RsmE family RNA methyltransferase [Ilumatobacter sp.]|nr:RsmE family RNA methyltransferase [Ilumatobacter sp.]
MTPEAAESLRRSAAHVVVDDVTSPILSDGDAHHLFRVLRVAEGDVVSVTDGRGAWRLCRAVDGSLEATTPVTVEPPRSMPVTIGLAIPKLDRPEWIVQKLTELGVDRIVWLHAERSVVRWDDQRAAKHLARLERVAVEAVQQSRRVTVPVIDAPKAALSFLPGASVAEPGGRPDDGCHPVVAIGPEGGWTERELAAAADRISLGPTVLRVETAALVAAARRTCHPA